MQPRLQPTDELPDVRRQTLAEDRRGALGPHGVGASRTVGLGVADRGERQGRRRRVPRFFFNAAPGDQQPPQPIDRLALAQALRLGVRRLGFGEPVAQAAHDAQHRLGALEIAPHPEQIVGGAAGQIAEHAHDAGVVGGRQQRRRFDLALAEHPDVGAGRDDMESPPVSALLLIDAAIAAGHHPPAVLRRRREDAQREGAWGQGAVDPGRRGREG